MSKNYIGYDFYRFKGCKVITPYRDDRMFITKVRNALYRITKTLTFGINKEIIEDKSNVYLIYDSISPLIAKFLRKHKPSCRIIVYYINPVSKSFPLEEYKKYGCEIWSFDESDCAKYGLNYNGLHYFGTEVCSLNQKKEYDVVFIGADKNRIGDLLRLKNELDDIGLNSLFHIVKSKRSKNKTFNYSKPVSYPYNLSLVFKSKAILDIMQTGQTGYTMRVAEALVNHIKLITNNKEIEKYSFYNSNNIFVLGSRPMSELPQFVSSPWDDTNNNSIEILTFDHWIKLFNI